MKAYLQSKSSSGDAFSTIRLDIKVKLLRHHKLNLQETRTGYGSRLRTRYMALLNGSWRRVMARCWSNTASFYLSGVPGYIQFTED